jgi:hypothetical protein
VAAGEALAGGGDCHIHHAPAPSSATSRAPPIAIGISGGPSPRELLPAPRVGVRSIGCSSGSNSILACLKGNHDEHEGHDAFLGKQLFVFFASFLVAV